jgi:hypothetical protein
MARKKRIGILTAGGDSPGLNAAIRGIGKAAIGHHGMTLVGFRAMGSAGRVMASYTEAELELLNGFIGASRELLKRHATRIYDLIEHGEPAPPLETQAGGQNPNVPTIEDPRPI